MAEAALGLYGLGGARVVSLRSGFKQVFRVDSPDSGRLALRLYKLPPAVGDDERSDPAFRFGAGLRSPETLCSQLRWLSALARETDLAVPEPVQTPDGTLVGRVSLREAHPRGAFLRRLWRRNSDAHRPENAERHCALLRWVPGEPKRRNLDPAGVAGIGAFVARLHGHAEAYAVPDPSALPRWDWDWPFGGSVPLWDTGEGFFSAGEMAVFRESARRARRDLDRLGYGSAAFGMIHRDLKLENLQFRETGAVGAIDFDMSGLGHYLLDLAVVVQVVERRAARTALHRPGTLREALLEGYARERPLPDDHARYLRTFAAMRRVHAVNRELRGLAGGASPPGSTPAGGERLLLDSASWLESNYLDEQGNGEG